MELFEIIGTPKNYKECGDLFTEEYEVSIHKDCNDNNENDSIDSLNKKYQEEEEENNGKFHNFIEINECDINKILTEVSKSYSNSDTEGDDDENYKNLFTVKKKKTNGKNFQFINFTPELLGLNQAQVAKKLKMSTNKLRRVLTNVITQIPSLSDEYFKPGKRRIMWPHRNCSNSPLVIFALENNGIQVRYEK
ncbi:hypothetical protein RB653_005298 [Dictyostelium firmibasis]|uniref:Uncharacterized protein n=1 Tax=Dictyostelium firmibasis TaxID=79012 RepID=A0AAN7Z406_9MYCE